MSAPHESLLAWKLSLEIVKDVYTLTKSFPNDERFGLISQMRRCAVSVPSNIAEGAAGRSPNQFRYYLAVSIGSLAELQTHIEISRMLGYTSDKKANEANVKINRVKALASGLKKSLIKLK